MNTGRKASSFSRQAGSLPAECGWKPHFRSKALLGRHRVRDTLPAGLFLTRDYSAVEEI